MACSHYAFELEEEHRHFVRYEKYNNCVLCVATERGPMSQEEVGAILGITKMRVSQIESKALKKCRKRSSRYQILSEDDYLD